MNRPSWPTYALGNTPVALLLTLTGLVLLCRWWMGLDDFGAAIVGGAMVGAACKARSSLTAYRRWKQAWDAMGDAPVAPPSMLGKRLIGAAIIGVVGVYLFAHSDAAAMRLGFAWLVVGICVTVIVAAIRRWRVRPVKATRRSSADMPVVALNITQPLLDVPPLGVAYQRLPAHCLQLLSGGQSSPRH